MRSHFIKFILIIALLSFPAIGFAQSAKVITLTDGSVLNGKVTELIDGIYTIETSNLGLLTIPQSDILTIASPQAGNTQIQNTADTQKADLKDQVQKMQGDILSNPGLMMEIQNLVSDAEIQSMLADPTLLNDVMSYDPEKIQKNNAVQRLLQNKKMQELMEKIQQKMPAEQK